MPLPQINRCTVLSLRVSKVGKGLSYVSLFHKGGFSEVFPFFSFFLSFFFFLVRAEKLSVSEACSFLLRNSIFKVALSLKRDSSSISFCFISITLLGLLSQGSVMWQD